MGEGGKGKDVEPGQQVHRQERVGWWHQLKCKQDSSCENLAYDCMLLSPAAPPPSWQQHFHCTRVDALVNMCRRPLLQDDTIE